MTAFDDELARRMTGPQRHRLLQGYPMLPLHREAAPVRELARRLDGQLLRAKQGQRELLEVEPPWVRLDASRALIIGLLPHTQCNPRVEGCGFCTFPHDRYQKSTLNRSVEHVAEQVEGVFASYPELTKRRVDAVYFGGATANLTPGKWLAELGRTLAKHVDLSHAEVTLEGVPSMFRSLFAGPFEALLTIPARHRRISMGVQTFDGTWIARMGRQAFGDRRTVQAVVDKAHRHDMTVSGDLLINLPGQTQDAIIEDLRIADSLGLDQLCIYHLVLTEGTGAPWAQDPALMAALPGAVTARAQWLSARDWLLSHGFVQTTLTNFERATVHATDRRFVYEEHSFSPESYDALGLGPMAISTFTELGARRAVKYVRGKSLSALTNDDLFFPYAEEDLRLLFLTRTLARLSVDRARYRALFGDDVTAHFGEALDAVVGARLATLDEDALRLTPDGMFFADSVAGLLAWRRALELRATSAGQHTRDLLERRLIVDFMG